MPKSYSPEFRSRVLDLCRSGGRRPREVANEFGVSEATVYRGDGRVATDLLISYDLSRLARDEFDALLLREIEALAASWSRR